MYLRWSLALLAFSSQACLAHFPPPLVPTTKNTLPSTSVVFQLEKNNTWFENIIVQPNGNLLATRLDVPELWSIVPGPNNTMGSGSSLYTFPNATSLLGIASISHNTYVVISGNVSLSTFTATPASFAIWTIDVTTPDYLITRLLVRIPEASFLDGNTHFNKDIYLITDAVKGQIWNLNITSGEYSIDLSQSMMLPASSSSTRIGVNGVKVKNGYIYFTSTTKGIFGRIPVNKKAVQTGHTEVITSGFILDDFYLTPDGRAYLATNSENRLFEVLPEGNIRLVAGGLNELTVAGLTAVTASQDGRILYVTTNGGMSAPVSCATVEPGKVVAVRL
jgi:hypothetical protein